MMKKLNYLLFTLFIGLLMISVVMAKGTIEIEKIELDSKSDNTVINSEPSFSGLTMNYDVSFDNPGDFVRYKVYIKNSTDKDYEVANETMFSEKKYFKYEFKDEDIIKANRTTVFYITVSYNDEVNEEEYLNGIYEEDNEVVVKLLDNGNVVNPNTSSSIFGFIVLTISSIALVLLIMYGKKHGFINNSFVILLFGMACIPFIVKAVEELKIQANVKASVKKVYTVTYNYELYDYLSYEEADNGEYGCDSLYYFGSVSDENRYYQCTKVEQLEEKYHVGDLVTVKTIKYNKVKYDDNCSFNISYTLCNEKIIVENYHSFQYDSYFFDDSENNEELLWLNIKDENGELLEFPENYWDFHDGIYLGNGYTFIMPPHDMELGMPEL